MSEEELKMLIDEIWELYDEDGNGVLDPYEVKQFLSDMFLMFGEFIDEGHQNQILDIIDKNRDGQINKNELTLLFSENLEEIYY